MKYIVTEQQIEDYKNGAKIQYTPEKIDAFVSDAQKCATYLKKSYDQFHPQVLALSVGDVMEKPEQVKQILDKLEKEKHYVDKLMLKYYSVIEMYAVGEYPDNVMQLDKLYGVIDHLQSDVDNIKDIYQSVYDSVTHFIKWNQEKFK